MKILLVITAIDVGGAEMQVLDLSKYLLDQGYFVNVVSLRGKRRLHDEFEKAGIPVHFLNMEKPWQLVSALIWYRRIVRLISPDVVHSHMVHANLFCRIGRIFIPIKKLICTAHSNNEGGKVRTCAYRLTDRLANYTTQVSQAAAKEYLEKGIAPPGKLGCIPNAIDVQKFKADPGSRVRIRTRHHLENAFVFVNVARLEPEKDHLTLLKAFQALAATAENVRLMIIGDGTLRAKLEAYSRNANLAEKVLFLGRRTAVPDFLNAGDCFVLSSKWEGFGLVVAEALAVGMPVIATDCGGPGEILRGGAAPDYASRPEIGRLVPVGDPVSMADAMKQVMSMTLEERAREIARGRRIVNNNYTFDAVGKQWQQLYRSI